MDILYLLIPLSVALVVLIGGALWWSVETGQFEGLEAEGLRILDEERGTCATEVPRKSPERGILDADQKLAEHPNLESVIGPPKGP